MMPHRFRQWTTALPVFLAVHAPATVLYVDLNSTNPTPPYTNWISAATNILDAVDAAVAGDRVLVTNGVLPHRQRERRHLSCDVEQCDYANECQRPTAYHNSGQ